jgi:hypothetical protein
VVGQKVIHKSWGIGTITEISGTTITVDFGGQQSKFVYPDAFEKFLTCDDPAFMEEVNTALQSKQEARAKAMSSLAQTAITPSHPQVQKRKYPKKVERSNVAFKCNYCDGGKNKVRIGFHGVCSDSVIRYNIAKLHHVWCSSEECPCRSYYDGEISRDELENMMTGSNGMGSVCYESHMLRDWKASAGIVQTGIDKGKPMRLLKVQPNSLAVLTSREPNYTTDESRFIFAVFLVDENYEGDNREEGYVTTHSDWKIELSPNEARKMLFWNYYVNQNAPQKIVFGSGLHRYLSDEQAAQILRDIIAVKGDPKEQEFARKFYEHFCTINAIDAEEVPLPSGALMRNK